jgi:hypothetical protein
MDSIPEGCMFSEGGISVSLKLSLKRSMQVWGDGWLASRRRLGSKVDAISLLSQPTFQSADADGEGGDHVLAGHAASDCRKDALT